MLQSSIDNLPLDLPYFFNFQEKELCKGRQTYDDQVQDPQCLYLHRGHPYLRLGPFKYETLNDIPHVASIRDFASDQQVKEIKDKASGKMRATPLKVSDSISDYTRFRTSKVMYMNEASYEVANRLSQRLNLALKI